MTKNYPMDPKDHGDLNGITFLHKILDDKVRYAILFCEIQGVRFFIS